jgi:hypothetical protein
VKLTPQEVEDYNRLQVLRSAQRVSCAADDFRVAREVRFQHPEVRDANRPRTKVEVTPIKDMKNYIFVTALE